MARRQSTNRTTGFTVTRSKDKNTGASSFSVKRQGKLPTTRELKHKEKLAEEKYKYKTKRAEYRGQSVKSAARSSAVVGSSASAADTVTALAKGGINDDKENTPTPKPKEEDHPEYSWRL